MQIKRAICRCVAASLLSLPLMSGATLVEGGTRVGLWLYDDPVKEIAGIGQTFTTNSGNNWLTSFSFWMTVGDGSPSVQAHLYQWSTESSPTKQGKMIGSALFSSAYKTVLDKGEVVFETPGIQLIENTAYIAFLTMLGGTGDSIATGDSIPDRVDLNIWKGVDPISTGSIFVKNFSEAKTLADLTTKNWGTADANKDIDLAFTANLIATPIPSPSKVPEPGTLTLLLGGLGMLAFSRKEKRKAA